MCFSGYITASTDTPSKSGMYFTDLAGCTVALLDDLTKEDHADWEDCFDYLYKTAQRNLRIDVQRKLADRFHIDKKLITRETSENVTPTEYNTGTDLAGVSIEVTMPKYGRTQLLTFTVFTDTAYTDASFKIYKDDENGDYLAEVLADLSPGKNTIQVYQDFEYEKLAILYDPAILNLRKTKNLYYSNDVFSQGDVCTFDCIYGEDGSVTQVNGGGINVKFVLYCSLEKFICENINLFQIALLYRLGVDTMKERITTQRVNMTSVLTEERAKELMAIHNEDYKAAVEAATMSIKMQEDPICFNCKKSVSSKTNLP